jgi:hypothetical protein
MGKPNALGIDTEDQLNRAMPANARVKLGSILAELIAANNAQNAVIKALVTKLNADAGVTDVNYSSAALTADMKTLDQR